MIVSGEAYSQRLRTFSDSTMLLILKTKASKEISKKAHIIIANTDYTEEQVVERIKELMKSKK